MPSDEVDPEAFKNSIREEQVIVDRMRSTACSCAPQTLVRPCPLQAKPDRFLKRVYAAWPARCVVLVIRARKLG